MVVSRYTYSYNSHTYSEYVVHKYIHKYNIQTNKCTKIVNKCTNQW